MRFCNLVCTPSLNSKHTRGAEETSCLGCSLSEAYDFLEITTFLEAIFLEIASPGNRLFDANWLYCHKYDIRLKR